MEYIYNPKMHFLETANLFFSLGNSFSSIQLIKCKKKKHFRGGFLCRFLVGVFSTQVFCSRFYAPKALLLCFYGKIKTVATVPVQL